MGGIAAYKTEIKYGGTPTSMSSEPTSQSSDDGSLFVITDDTKRVLNRESSAVPTVYVDGSEQDSSDYSLNFLFGKIEFESTQPSSADVTISGEYIPVGSTDKITHCSNHEVTMESALLDDTGNREAQESSGHRSRVLGLEDSNITLSRFEDGLREFKDALDSKESVLIEIRPGGGDLIFRGWYATESVNFSGGVEDLESKDISLQADVEKVEKNLVGFGWSS